MAFCVDSGKVENECEEVECVDETSE